MGLQDYQQLLTEIFQATLVKLCSENFPVETNLEIDGLICININDLNRQIVVKIHKIINSNDNEILTIKTLNDLQKEDLKLSILKSCNLIEDINNLNYLDLNQTKENDLIYHSRQINIINKEIDLSIKHEKPESNFSQNSDEEAINLSLTNESLDLSKPYTCKICFSTQETIQEYEDHIKDIHKRILCKLCLSTFTLPSNFKRHMKLHTGVRPFKCQICSTAFSRNTDLKLHIIKHLGNMPQKNKFTHENSNNISVIEDDLVCSICKIKFSYTNFNDHYCLKSNIETISFNENNEDNILEAITNSNPDYFNNKEITCSKNLELMQDSLSNPIINLSVGKDHSDLFEFSHGSNENLKDDFKSNSYTKIEIDKIKQEKSIISTIIRDDINLKSEFLHSCDNNNPSNFNIENKQLSLFLKLEGKEIKSPDFVPFQSNLHKSIMKSSKNKRKGTPFKQKLVLNSEELNYNSLNEDDCFFDMNINIPLDRLSKIENSKSYVDSVHKNKYGQNFIKKEQIQNEQLEMKTDNDENINSKLDPEINSGPSENADPFYYLYNDLKKITSTPNDSYHADKFNLKNGYNYQIIKNKVNYQTLSNSTEINKIYISTPTNIIPSQNNSSLHSYNNTSISNSSFSSNHDPNNSPPKIYRLINSISSNSQSNSYSSLSNMKSHSIIPFLNDPMDTNTSLNPVHLETRSFVCRYGGCQTNWAGFRAYENHYVDRHWRYPCQFCDQSFTSRNNRRRHANTHVSGKQHDCNVCQKRFTRMDIVKEHKLTHTASYKKGVCSFCGFFADKKTVLMCHLKSCFKNEDLDADIKAAL